MQVATAFVDGRLPKPSSLLLGSGGGTSRGTGYTPGPAVMVQVRFFFGGGRVRHGCVCHSSAGCGRERGEGCTQFVHGRCRMTIDPRFPTMPGRSNSDFH